MEWLAGWGWCKGSNVLSPRGANGVYSRSTRGEERDVLRLPVSIIIAALRRLFIVVVEVIVVVLATQNLPICSTLRPEGCILVHRSIHAHLLAPLFSAHPFPYLPLR